MNSKIYSSWIGVLKRLKTILLSKSCFSTKYRQWIRSLCLSFCVQATLFIFWNNFSIFFVACSNIWSFHCALSKLRFTNNSQPVNHPRIFHLDLFYFIIFPFVRMFARLHSVEISDRTSPFSWEEIDKV